MLFEEVKFVSSKIKIFSKIFGILADDNVLSQKQMAKEIWKILKDEKISPESLGINNVLIKLGLAEREYDPVKDEDIVIYEE